jgi:energy-converting hydrogenase Eha subunit E
MCTNAAWCFGMLACHACQDCMNASFKQQVRLAYFVFDAIFVALGLVILYGASSLLVKLDWIKWVLDNYLDCGGDGIASCLGISSVYRLSLALVALHVLILLMLLLRNGCSRVFNEEVWPFKVVLIVIVFVGCFFIKNESFKTYSNIAMIFSFFFLLFQIVMIIDLFYSWGVNWVKYYDEGKNIWMYMLIITTVLLYVGSGYFTISSFKNFAGCGVGTSTTVINVIFMIIAVALVLLRFNPEGSLLTSAAVSLITSYMTWSGLSNQDLPCNSSLTASSTTIINLVVGLVFIITSLIYVSIGSSEDNSGNVAPAGVNIPQAVLAEHKNEDDSKRERLNDEEAAGLQNQRGKEELKDLSLKPYQSNSFIYFHIILLFASCYIAMLLTNWGAPVIDGAKFFDFQEGSRSMWIKLATAWVTMGLYVWTIIAPTVCPDRDFS